MPRKPVFVFGPAPAARDEIQLSRRQYRDLMEECRLFGTWCIFLPQTSFPPIVG